MKALSNSERETLLTEIDEFNSRLVAKNRERDGIAAKKAALARDVVTGKSGAKSAALKLADVERDLALEIDALETAIQQSQQRWDDDAPARAAEAAEAKRTATAEAAAKARARLAACDKPLQEFVRLWRDAMTAVEAAVSAGMDDNIRNQITLDWTLSAALWAAGLRKTDWSKVEWIGERGPNSFAEVAAERLRFD